nr:unnamed protein product [Haemonchus contortus]
MHSIIPLTLSFFLCGIVALNTAGMLVRLPIALLWILPVSMAINCYRGAIYNSTAKPTEQITCQMINYCTKITAVLPVSLATYGCDQSAALCKVIRSYKSITAYFITELLSEEKA